jgi:hypothetical protein
MIAICVVAAAVVWWLAASLFEPELFTAPQWLLFYSPWWVPIIAYLVAAEPLARRLSRRWSPAIFLAIAGCGYIFLVAYLRFGQAPFLFSDAERAANYKYLILRPTLCVAAFVQGVSLWHRFRRS